MNKIMKNNAKGEELRAYWVEVISSGGDWRYTWKQRVKPILVGFGCDWGVYV